LFFFAAQPANLPALPSAFGGANGLLVAGAGVITLLYARYSR
jgi:hypothetical protein